MSEPATHAEMNSDSFRSRFQELIPLLLREWPSLDRAALEQTLGDLDKTVEMISDLTDQSRTRIRNQIGDLAAMVSPSRAASELERVLGALEKRTEELAERLRAQVPDVREKARENIGFSILTALGLGLFLGLLLGWRLHRGRD